MKYTGTGLTGFLGREIDLECAARDIQKIPLINDKGAPYRLGDKIKKGSLSEVGFFIHCAYDFTCKSWKENYDVNVIGSINLLKQAIEENVSLVCFISSFAAYPEAKSDYGKAKQLVEDFCIVNNIHIIKPGLVIGDNGEGIFGKLETIVKKLPIVPLIGNGMQPQYIVHSKDVARYVVKWALTSSTSQSLPIYLAHSNPFTILQLLKDRENRFEVKRFYIKIPIFLVTLAFNLTNFFKIPLPFRKDSLTGLLYTNNNLINCKFELGPLSKISDLKTLNNNSKISY